MSQTQMVFDDCFVTKYKRLRGLVPGISCDTAVPTLASTTSTSSSSSSLKPTTSSASDEPRISSSSFTRSKSSHQITNNVDYFSFRLTEKQLSQCWKIIHRKAAMKDVKILNKASEQTENMYNKVEDLMLLIPSTSSVRLENSAWRAWAKERFQLKELNPAELNWFKENDITWLYGPLIMTDEDEAEQAELEQQQQQAEQAKQQLQEQQEAKQKQEELEKEEEAASTEMKIARSASNESLSSIASTETISSVDTASTSITCEDLVNFHSKPLTKPILKTADSSLTKLRRFSFDELSSVTTSTRRANNNDANNTTTTTANSSRSSSSKRTKRVSFSTVMEKREIINDEIFDYNLKFIDNERIGFAYYN